MKRSIQTLPMEPPPLIGGTPRDTLPGNMKFVHCLEPEGKHSGKARRRGWVVFKLEATASIYSAYLWEHHTTTTTTLFSTSYPLILLLTHLIGVLSLLPCCNNHDPGFGGMENPAVL